MPFANLSDNPEYLYLADGLTDDLITDLARISDLFVIAYNSVGNYRGREDAVRNTGRELGVRYVMQGSLRRLDQKLRVNVALIDTSTGGHLWADRYDTGYEDLFTLEDDIVNSIARKLALKVTASQQASIDERETTSIAAYDAYRRGWANALRKTPDGLAEALKLFKQAVTIDPDYARAQAALGLVYWNAWIWGWEVERRRDLGDGADAGGGACEAGAAPADGDRLPARLADQPLRPHATTRRGVSPSWPSISTRRTPAARWRWPR